MKTRTVAWVACAAMMASCAFVYTITPAGGARADITAIPGPETQVATAAETPARFSGGETLSVDARLGYRALPRAGARENLILVEVAATGTPKQAQTSTSSTAIVIDRSGSMSGPRLSQAKEAAAQWVAQLADGDHITVVTFNNDADVVVRPTTLTGGTRGSVLSAIESIVPGGSTCLSCGIDRALELLRIQSGIRRMIVLSDGHANHGAQTLAEFRQIAGASRAQETSIVTLGVGTAYSEAALAALAFETNGTHHFVADPFTMRHIFAAEAEKLAATLATSGEVTLDLGPDIELVRVFDRAHRREGERVVVPMGAFSAGQRKTVLAEVRVKGDGAPHRPIAAVTFRYRDGRAQRMRVSGQLSVKMAEQRSELDPMVSVRLARGAGADAMEEAASLFEQGRREEAVQLLDRHRNDLEAQAAAAPEPAAKALASAIATASAAKERIQAAPRASARSEVLRSKVSSNEARE